MYLDAQEVFSNAQAITGTAVSADHIDLTGGSFNATRDIGAGEDVWLVINTVGTLTDSSGTDATLTVTIETDDNTGFSSATTVATVVNARAVGSGIAGGTTLYAGPLPSFAYERYLGLRYTVASGPLAAGSTVDAFLTRDVTAWRAYVRNFTTA